MRTSLNEIRSIEIQLQKAKKNPEEYLYWKARLLIDPELNAKVKWQEKAYKLIRYFGRKSLKKDLNTLHQNLMLNPANKHFQLRVREIFSNS